MELLTLAWHVFLFGGIGPGLVAGGMLAAMLDQGQKLLGGLICLIVAAAMIWVNAHFNHPHGWEWLIFAAGAGVGFIGKPH